MQSKDLKLENNDIYIDPVKGDFLITESDTQHVQDIINSFVGWWKEFPTIGVGIKKYLGASGGVQVVKRAIKIQLKSDGYRTDKIIIKGEKIFITGERIAK
tara:strand:+ start:3840 stop:4142 length:303 start_codon:yes stop_codon:yes gene_type:complete